MDSENTLWNDEADEPQTDQGPLLDVAAEQDKNNLSLSLVQGEWTQMLRQLEAVCELIEAGDPLSTRYAHLQLRLHDGHSIEEVDTIIFNNLLFAPWTRNAHFNKWIIDGEWLWRWRKAVPWRAEKLEGISLLPPDAKRNQWRYRFNMVEVE
jgi:hypothetical protein